MSGAPKRRPPRMLEVLAVQRLSPHMKRVSLGGAEREGLVTWPAAQIKLFFPRAGQSEPKLPGLDASGRALWPAPAERPVTRTYSVRRDDPCGGTLEVDFVIHTPHGPASAWAARAEPGMRIGLAGPGGPRPLLKPADSYLLAGDLSALSALSALLEALPDTARGSAFVQIPDARDRLSIAAPPGLQIIWVIGEDSARAGQELVRAVRELGHCTGDAFVWLAGEASQVVSLRDHFLGQGLAPTRLYAVPYWKRSQSEEEYHEERHRVMDELGAEDAS